MDRVQRGVARGMGLALLTAIAVLAVAATSMTRFSAIAADVASRASVASWSILLPATTLLVCIARLAKHRFFTPADIDGSALSPGTERARLLQTLLQNTLEQACLAVPVYIATAVLAPASMMLMVPAAAVMFLVGRLLFFRGYAGGAASRAFGFALTFYPTMLLLFLVMALYLVRLAA